MKSLIMAALLTISPITTAMDKYPVMGEAAGMSRVLIMQCKTKGYFIVSLIVNGKIERYLIDCVVTELEGTEQ